MKNLKQPEYNPDNLINFHRENLWMNEVKQSKSEHAQFPFVQVTVTLICVIGLIVGVKMMGGF